MADVFISYARSPDIDRARVAVRPFAPLGQDPAERAAAVALSDEVTGVLSENGVQTLADASGAGAGAAASLRRQGVAYALGGAVRREGGLLKVRAYLEDVGSGTILWSESFQRDQANAATLQDAVAISARPPRMCS